MRVQRLHLIYALFALPGAAAVAGTVAEAESNGFSANNTRATAQNISPGTFAPNASPNVFGSLPTANVKGHLGGNDVDFFSFTTSGGTAYFSTTGTTNGLDTYLALFNSSGTILGDNDDSFPSGPGASLHDSFLGQIQLAAGTYFIAITSGGNSATASFSGTMFNELFRPDGVSGGFAFGDADAGIDSFLRNGDQVSGGDYTLNISIPTPGALGFAAVLGLGLCRRRRYAL